METNFADLLSILGADMGGKVLTLLPPPSGKVSTLLPPPTPLKACSVSMFAHLQAMAQTSTCANLRRF